MGMSTETKLDKSDLSIYASGSGALHIKVNCPMAAEVNEQSIQAYVDEFKPELKGWLIKTHHPANPRHYYFLVHPFTNLTGTLYDHPAVVRDELTGKVYKVLVDDPKAKFWNIHDLTVIGADPNGARFEVKNLSLLSAIVFYLNNHKSLNL
jgi:hypothetical protein